jgi:hypothetical protein
VAIVAELNVHPSPVKLPLSKPLWKITVALTLGTVKLANMLRNSNAKTETATNLLLFLEAAFRRL